MQVLGCLAVAKRSIELGTYLVVSFNILAADSSMWPGSSVSIATGYGLDGPGIEYR